MFIYCISLPTSPIFVLFLFCFSEKGIPFKTKLDLTRKVAIKGIISLIHPCPQSSRDQFCNGGEVSSVEGDQQDPETLSESPWEQMSEILLERLRNRKKARDLTAYVIYKLNNFSTFFQLFHYYLSRTIFLKTPIFFFRYTNETQQKGLLLYLN